MALKPRYSEQREGILNIILADGGHLTVENIYALARAEMPRISLATVYRNLKQLEELKKLSQTQGADQVNYYETFSEPHHHFICNSCKSIKNMDTPTVKTCTGCITTSSPIKVDHVVTTLFGTCSDCLTD